MPAEPNGTNGDGTAIAFGPYRLVATRRLLLEGDKAVRLGGRAFDILIALVESPGEVVTKEELIARAWPTTHVDEANLKIQISALRRALGDGQGDNRYIATVIGRGYNFVAPVREEELSRPTSAPAIGGMAPHNLPFATIRMIGREAVAAMLVAQLSRRRLVTVVGPGGVGKTTLALDIAERMIGAYEHGVWLVDLASLSDPRLVPGAVATVLGAEVRAEDALSGLVAALSDRRLLLVLDNCEHVVAAAARLAAAVLGGTPGITILATSREPLGVPGERTHRLVPLALPEPSSELTAAEAAAFPAVGLFVERVTAIVEDFVLTDANASLVVAICRRLDGLPLAIEFAAPRVEILGVEGLAARLDDSLGPLSGVRSRAAVPRHRTMRAVMDWSYGLLSDGEQRFFRVLGIFAGGFAVEAGTAAAGTETTGVDAIERLVDMVAKSLVVADVTGARARFRLLGTTRAYAIRKLDESGEREQIARCHAEYFRDLFEHAEREMPTRPPADWLADYTPELDNLRAALDWALSSAGDNAIALALTNAAQPLWMRLSLQEECAGRARRVLAAIGTAENVSPRDEMRLRATLGASTSRPEEMGTALTRTLQIARSLGDIEYQLRALRGLHLYNVGDGRFRAAYPFAREFYALTRRGSDRANLMFGERMMGVAEHYTGNQTQARRHLERVLARNPVIDPGRDSNSFQDVVRFGIDLNISVQTFLARVFWLLGFADQAVGMAEKSRGEAEATGHVISQCHVLAMASCPIAFWVGDYIAAASYTARLVDLSRRHVLPHWAALGARFDLALTVRGGDAEPVSLGSGGPESTGFRSTFRSLTGLMQLVEALGEAGRIDEGLALLDHGIGQFEANCFTPELIRLKGELTLSRDAPGSQGSAEIHFRQALDQARRHGMLSWELRGATSLARLLRRQGRYADAAALLQPVHDRFSEGFGTADLIAAKQLLPGAVD